MTALGNWRSQVEQRLADLAREMTAARGQLSRLAAGGEGEALVARVLDDAGIWRLSGRLRPGSRRADIDHVVVHRSGAWVIDVKHWGDVTIEGGRLFNGQDDCSDCLSGVLAQAADVRQVLEDTGLAPLEVHPLIVFSRCGSAMPPSVLGNLTLVGVDHLLDVVRPGPSRLSEAQVAAVRERLEGALVEHGATPLSSVRRAVQPPDVEQLCAFDLERLDIEQMRAAASLPLEEWMVWIDPTQHQHVRRSWNGPARVKGPAGSGKTVLALHRAAHLATSSPAPILVTSYVRTLPAVLAAHFARLAPNAVERVEFRSLHSVALGLLDKGTCLDVDASRGAYNLAWVEHRARLEPLGLDRRYCEDEITWVIKGRDLRSRAAYLETDRPGRRIRLGEPQRHAVFDLYETYERHLAAKGIVDLTDVLRLARDMARTTSPQYRHVIADEVQDLPSVGLQLLRAMVPEGPDDLFLVGDGQQTIYPGGGTLKAADILVTGRSVTLSVNYRNAEEILKAALATVSGERYDDLDAADEVAPSEVTTRRAGGRVVTEHYASRAELEAGLVTALRADLSSGSERGAAAVLVATNAEANRVAALLRGAGIPMQPLMTYDGAPVDAVKVGTVKRAKGLEFDTVYLPCALPAAAVVDDDEAARRRREVFVAMTRARSALWVGTVVA